MDPNKALNAIRAEALPARIKMQLGRIAAILTARERTILTAKDAFERILQNKVHHPQCVIDNCRPACPVRIAQEALAAMTREMTEGAARP